MIGNWFTAPQTGNLVWVLAVDMIVNVTILILLACATHALIGRRRVLIRSGLWNAVLLAAILQPAACWGSHDFASPAYRLRTSLRSRRRHSSLMLANRPAPSCELSQVLRRPPSWERVRSGPIRGGSARAGVTWHPCSWC